MSTSYQSSQLSQSIVKTLLYFDLFSYPLKTEEVYRHLQSNHVSEADVNRELLRLSSEKVLFQTGEFYSMQEDISLIERRLAGNRKAEQYLRIAQRRARWIYRFPFVRGVMISGSLSKYYADENTDIDFFIITAPGRLWVARTLLVLFKRVFLFNSHKFFCVNYFIDENHLELEERNLFTATELTTLLPMYGHRSYQELMQRNPWVLDLLPNARHKAIGTGLDRTGWVKQGMEKILSYGLGNWLEKKCMQLSQSRWHRLYGNKLSPVDFRIAFKSKAYVSKNHPDNYQRKIMERYRRKLEEFAVVHTWKWVYD